MAARNEIDAPPEDFREALDQLRAATLRPEIFCEEMPAPQRIAPYSAAMTADVTVAGEEVGGGRLVVLYDPAGNDAWQGTFRCVAYARADIDPEMVTDPLLGAVGWTWLIEALERARGRVPRAERHRHQGRVRELRRHGRRAVECRDRGTRIVVAARLVRPTTSRPGATCSAPRPACRRFRPASWRCRVGVASGLDDIGHPSEAPPRSPADAAGRA